MTKSIQQFIREIADGEVRLCAVTRLTSNTLLHVESMTHPHVLAITISIPNEVVDEYDTREM